MYVHLKRTRLGLCALLILVSSGSAAENSPELATLFGGSPGLRVVREAQIVRAYKMVTPNEWHESIADFEMRDQPVVVPRPLAANLSRTLLSRDAYEWDAAKACEPVYGVRLEFVSGKETVDVLFCFGCDILSVFRNGQSVGQRDGSEDFDDIRADLLKIIKPLFPDAEDIQALKD